MPEVSKATNKNEKVIKFDMNTDNAIRASAKKQYEVAKNFKLAKLPLYKFYSANEISVKKQFNLGQKTDLTILEIKLSNNIEKDFIKISEAKDFIQTQDNIELIDDKDFKYDAMNLVHRFLVFCK